MKLLLSSFLFGFSCVLCGQSADSLKLLSAAGWRTVDTWFGADTLRLVAKPYPAGWSEEQKTASLRDSSEREHIVFDSMGNLAGYSELVKDAAGGAARGLQKFQLSHGRVEIVYTLGHWKDKPVEHLALYDVVVWTKERIVLSLHQP